MRHLENGIIDCDDDARDNLDMPDEGEGYQLVSLRTSDEALQEIIMSWDAMSLFENMINHHEDILEKKDVTKWCRL